MRGVVVLLYKVRRTAVLFFQHGDEPMACPKTSLTSSGMASKSRPDAAIECHQRLGGLLCATITAKLPERFVVAGRSCWRGSLLSALVSVGTAWPGCNLRRKLRSIFLLIPAYNRGRSNENAFVFLEISADGFFDYKSWMRTPAKFEGSFALEDSHCPLVSVYVFCGVH